jgi:hypothetical protein
MDRLNKDLDGIQIIDELHSNIGIGTLQLNHDTFFGGTDLIIRTAPEGNGTLLFIDTDYTLQDQNTRLSSEAGKPVYTSFKITNPNYQTGDLYFTYKTVGDFVEAADINELNDKVAANEFQVSGNIGGSTSFSFLAEDSREIQRIPISIPAGKQLKLKRARYYLGSASNLYLYIAEANYNGEWMSVSASGDNSLNITFYNNSTSSSVTSYIEVWLSSDQGSNITIQPYFSWCLDFSIE